MCWAQVTVLCISFSFNPQTYFGAVLLLSPIDRWKMWDAERLTSLPKATQLAIETKTNRGVLFWTQLASWLLCLFSAALVSLCCDCCSLVYLGIDLLVCLSHYTVSLLSAGPPGHSLWASECRNPGRNLEERRGRKKSSSNNLGIIVRPWPDIFRALHTFHSSLTQFPH